MYIVFSHGTGEVCVVGPLKYVRMFYASQNCATGTQNLENENVGGSGYCEAQHLKYSKWLPGGCQPYDHLGLCTGLC
jgi:hypothetical protein